MLSCQEGYPFVFVTFLTECQSDLFSRATNPGKRLEGFFSSVRKGTLLHFSPSPSFIEGLGGLLSFRTMSDPSYVLLFTKEIVSLLPQLTLWFPYIDRVPSVRNERERRVLCVQIGGSGHTRLRRRGSSILLP